MAVTEVAPSSLIPHEGIPPTKQISLDGYLRREELAQLLGVSARTVDRWHSLRSGPPRIAIGRLILYNLESVRAWLQAKESGLAYVHGRRRRS